MYSSSQLPVHDYLLNLISLQVIARTAAQSHASKTLSCGVKWDEGGEMQVYVQSRHLSFFLLFSHQVLRALPLAAARQILAREGAIASGAPPDASGRPTNKATVDWLLMGAEEGTRDMTWEQIEEGADKLRVEGGGEGGAICKTAASRKQKSEGGIRTGNATKAACGGAR